MEKKAVGKGMKSQKQAYLFLAPSLIILTIFVFVPLVGAIAISIMNINIYMNDISFAAEKLSADVFGCARWKCDAEHVLLCASGGAAADSAGIAARDVYDK